ncbi:MAG: tetratricopeptide repeat protein [Planctomycetes bacterium]|nr:tetratricopeptide repeat protein [Planctomycetota bacterium]
MEPLDLANMTQVRGDESTGLKALFEKVYFDVPYGSEAVQALSRTRFHAGPKSGSKETTPEIAQGNFPEISQEKSPKNYHRPGSLSLLDLGSPAGPGFQEAKTILLYRGESGIGKTRVFRQFRNYAQERRVPVYEIHCYDVEGIPFKPFLRVIREILRDFQFGDLLREKYRPGLEALLPEIFRKDSKSPVLRRLDISTWEEDKIRIFDGLTQLLFEITSLRPVVILVHDLNWGDQGTIELLRYIGRNIQLRNARVAAALASIQKEGAPLLDQDLLLDEKGLEDPERLDLTSPASSRDSQKLASKIRSKEAGKENGKGMEKGGAHPPASVEELNLRPVRLLILANYQGSSNPDDYLEKALRSLGEEPFAYHAEIRRLNQEETRLFIEQSVDEVLCFPERPGPPEKKPLALVSEAAGRIHAYSEGFPSYIHELLRQVLEKQPELITADLVEEAMTGAGPAPAPEGSGPPLRRQILTRRLAGLEPEPLTVLHALALARKPLAAPFLGKVAGLPGEKLKSLLQDLLQAGLLEKIGLPQGEGEEGYFFRLWDYLEVLSDSLADSRQRQEIHERIGLELRELAADPGDEKAYEIFYHLRQGLSPRSALEFGLTAAERFARSFSVEKSILVLEDLLGIFTAPEDLETRLEVLDQKNQYHLVLKQFAKAEAAFKQLFSEGQEVFENGRRAELLIQEGELYRLKEDTNRALTALKKAFKYIGEVNSLLGARWHLVTGKIRQDRSDVKRAINFFLKGIKISQKLLEEAGGKEGAGDESPELTLLLAEMHRHLALTVCLRGNDTAAVDNLQKSLEGYEKTGDEAACAMALDDLGKVYLERGNYFRAARYFFRALEIRRRHQDIAGLCRSYDQLGLVYQRTGDEFKTIANLNRSILLKERIGDLKGLNPTLGVLGDLYFRLGRYDKAIAYIQTEIKNSQVLSDTSGLVEAFIRLGAVHLELGDRKQVENLTRQVGILATEFKLKAQEAGGARQRGLLEALNRNWGEAESQLKTALDIFARLGSRRQEAAALLDLADIKYARESFEEALKLVTKAGVLADQLKAVDLQVRATVLKGNIFRFLKGGNLDKAKDLLKKGFELGQNLNEVHRLFDIYYSLAKAYHYDRSFIEAGNYYGKAEAILRRIADELPDAAAARYFEDPRRKLFLEDANRFRKEVRGRPSGSQRLAADGQHLASGGWGSAESPALNLGARGQPVAVDDLEELNSRVLRVNATQHLPGFFDILLREFLDLVKAERGFIVRVQNRQYSVASHHGWGSDPEKDADFPAARSLAEETVRKGKSVLTAPGEENGGAKKLLQPGSALSQHTLLVQPLMTAERIFGAVYLDRAVSVGRFAPRDQLVVESLSMHCGAILDHRRRYESVIVEPLTGLYNTSYFLERLKELYRLNSLHGKSFFLIGFYLPTLEALLRDEAQLLGERLRQEVQAELPQNALASWGNPLLALLLPDVDFAAASKVAQQTETRLLSLVNCSVPREILAPDARIPNGIAFYYEMRHRLLPDENDYQALLEMRQLFGKDISLKDAKRILEKHFLENALRKTGGNITHAAKELGLHRPQLSNLLKKYALKRERFERGLDLDEIDPRAN